MNFTTPVGRMVYGSVWDGSDTDSKGVKRVIKSGPNAGKPAISWAFGVAFPKVLANGMPNEEFNKFYREVIEVCRTGYPQFYAGAIDPFTGKPGCVRPAGMALKIKDGDGVDANGKQNREKEGYAGHWIVSFSGMYAPRVFDINIGLDPMNQLQDKSRVLPGDYVAVSGTCEANIGAESPGVYMNGNMVCFIGAGPRIVSGPKAADVFANVMGGTLPPGCVPGATPASMPLTTGVAVPTPPMPTPVAPTPPMPTPAAAPASPQLTPVALAAGFTTYDAARAAGWTDDALRANGYLAPGAPPAMPTPPTPPSPPAAPMAPVAPVAPAAPQLTAAAYAAGFTSYEQARANNWTDEALRASGFIA